MRRLAELQDAVRNAGTPEKVLEVLNRLHALAIEGDVAAAKTWLDRILGAAKIQIGGDANGSPIKVELSKGPDAPPTADLLAGITRLGELAREHLGDEGLGDVDGG